jgi:replicative DNA helicase
MEVKFKRDKNFEEKVVQAIITDHTFAEQIMDTISTEYFNLDHLREITEIIFKYHEKYEAFPSLKLIGSIAKDTIESDSLMGKVKEFLVMVKTDPLNGDMAYVQEEALDFCKKRALAKALESSLGLIAEKKYEAVVDEIQNAIFAGSAKEIGHILPTGLSKRLVEIENEPIPTGWDYVDEITRGGPGRGKLCSILGASGAGKSHLLVNLGANMAKVGLNVAHYTMELSEEETGLRYDSNLSGIDIDNIRDNKEEVEAILAEVKGMILIKSFPMYGASSLTIKNHIKQLASRGMMPDVILIDYADIMHSRRKFDQLRLEHQHIYGELKALAKEMNVAIWTVCQANREGADSEILKEKHIGESYGKYQICDVFLTFSRKKENKKITDGCLYVCKNRLGPDGILYPIKANTAQSKITVLDPNAESDVIDLTDRIDKGHIDEQLKALRSKMSKMSD